jgi:hypothetical protein
VLIDQLPGRWWGRLLALAVTGAALTGCGIGPNQPGAAVIVGPSSVPLSEVQRQVDDVLRRPAAVANLTEKGGGPADLARFKVTRQVQHLLLVQAAQRDGIVLPDQRVDAELAKPEVIQELADNEFVFDPGLARETVRDRLIAEALTAKYLDRLAVTVDLTLAGSREEAVTKARLLAAGPAQADAVLAADGPNARRNLQLRAALLPQSAALFLFGTPAGEVVATQTSSSPDTWTVVRVVSRTTDGPPLGDPNATSLAQLGEQMVDQIGRRFTQPLAELLGVRVNPRYGTWDPLYLNVIPPTLEPSLVLPARLS